MEKKFNITKTVFYIFFAFCFLGAGIFCLNKTLIFESASAEVVESELDNRETVDYFSVLEKTPSGSGTEINPLTNDTFLYSNNNALSISLLSNGNEVNTGDNFLYYENVYYPDPTNKNNFQFYRNIEVNLEINGKKKDLTSYNFITSTSSVAFPNEPTSNPQKFEILFNNTGAESNAIKIVDENNKLIEEGVYKLRIHFTRFYTTNGENDISTTTFESEGVDIEYSFYMFDKSSYIINNNPVIKTFNFDKSIVTSNSITENSTGFYLYSNYSSENEANKIPYIEFDHTRFELDIAKTLQDKTTTMQISFAEDKNENGIAVSENNFAYTQLFKDENGQSKCRVFFTELGNYTIKFKAIFVYEEQNSEGQVAKRQLHNIDAVTGQAKTALVYMYGYQLAYTDHDKPTNSDGSHQTSEMKDYDFTANEFYNGADITSGFLNSNENFSQSNLSATFQEANIINYINNNKLSPVKTDQTPVWLNGNATLNPNMSYVFTTKKQAGYTQYGNTKLYDGTAEGSQLYLMEKFNGSSLSTTGTYIYVVAYTFNNYRLHANQISDTTVFYQIFYFQIYKSKASISLKTAETNKDVSSTEFYNESIILTDTTKEESYNQDIEILIYAKDYENGGFLSNFGGENGILLSELDTDHDNVVILEDSAHYSIWLYQKSTGITSKNEDYYFTIDKYEINYDDIKARTVKQQTNGTDYEIISDVNGFATNENFALSWQEKKSGAKTTAYYKRFSLENYNFYKESTTATQLSTFLQNHNSLPVNHALNMSTEGTIWNKLGNVTDNGNTLNKDTVSGTGNFVLSASGLYLVDIYDEAGNHTVKVFFLDSTTPIFAVSDGVTYSIPSSSIYITQSQNLYWGQNKLIRLINFNSFNFNNVKLDSNNEYYLEGSNRFVKDVISEYEFYKSKSKDENKNDIYSMEIFEAMYKLYQDQNKDDKPDYLEYYTFYSDTMTEYNGIYLKIPISNVSYFIDRQHSQYTKQTDVYEAHIGNEEEMTYRVLIRDMSNTKKAVGYADDAQIQYTNYFSAKQTIIISFDTSEFFVNFKNANGETEVLSSNTNEEDKENSVKTTYLSPSSMNKEFSVSFIPTTVIAGAGGESSKTIQIDTVEAKFYKAGKESKVEKNGITYYYYELSDSYSIIPIYQFNNVQNTSKISEVINATDGVTAAGKYEITRKYYFNNDAVDTEYYCNENDFITRTYVFYVDRYGVVTNPVYSEFDNKHSESMVGGDIFVTLYDNGTNADLLVSFPDSFNGNQNGNSIYNTGNLNITSPIFETNKLPLKLYIPQMKYTKSVSKNDLTNGYDFSVDINDAMNQFANNDIISEYVLYAEIYKDNLKTLYAATTTDLNNPTLDSTLATATENGFLTFYHRNNNTVEQLNGLSEAGTYYVRIYQGRFGNEIGENSFNQFLTFYFTIEESAPDFTVRTTNMADLNFDANDTTNDYSVRYHTNQSRLELVWDEGSTYMADIDKANIMFKFKGSRQEINAKTIFPDIENLKPVNGKYVLEINLASLGNYNIYSHDNYVDITMQYINHDDLLYSKVTKRIYVDLSAPLTTINSLVTKVTSGTIGESGGASRLSERMLRSRFQADGRTLATNDLNTCYNVSISTEPFAYYSYNVTNKTGNDFAQTLLTNKDYMTYVRAFSKTGSNAKYASTQNQETAPGDFRASNFTEISQFISEKGGFEVGTYYEIVETDLAGNMTIYTVYVTSYNANENADQEIIAFIDGSNQNSAYTISDFTEAQNYYKTDTMHNIYSKRGFNLQNINYFGDVWSQIYIRTRNAQNQVNTYYINLTPWGYAYDLVNQTHITMVDLRNLIDGSVNSTYKHLVQIYDRLNSQTENFYININNQSLRYELTKEENKEYLTITSNPSNEQIKNPVTAEKAFLTQLTITAILPDTNETIELYNKTNKLGFSELWTSNENIEVKADTNLRTLTFNVRDSIGFADNTRINYTFTDNYGGVYKEIHLYNESIISQEITVPQGKHLYSYVEEDTGRIYYLTDSTIQFNYNPRRYVVKVFDLENGKPTTNLFNATFKETPSNGISVMTITTTKTNLYDDGFIIVCYNAYSTDETEDITQTNPVKTIYFKLYNMLPTPNETNNINEIGQFKFLDTNGINITNEIVSGQASGETGYYSEVRLQYNSNISMEIPVVYSYSKDKTNWTEITSNTISFKCEDENAETYYIKVWYKEKFIENYYSSGYVFSFVPEEQIFEFTLTSLTQTYWIENTLTGEIINKSDYVFETTSGSYTHYIVNLSYLNSSYIKINTNSEQQITYTKIGEIQDETAESVWTYIYRISNLKNGVPPENISAYEVNIAISFIPPTDKIVTEFYTYDETTGKMNTNNNLANQLSKEIIVLQSSSLNQIELQWSEYYGIKQNKINLKIFKDGIELAPTVYTRYSNDKKKTYSYVYLTHSGKYTISFKDTSGNEHRFSNATVGQYKEFTLTFVKDVPFNVTYTNLMTGDRETTIPIREAIYNGSVTLKIDSSVLSSYYTYSCNVIRNGREYTGFVADTNTWTYTFNETGYYQVTFSATTATTESAIRTETYQFTILDEDEYKYSYIVNPYSNYYIEKVIKDGVDVTESLTQTLSVSKITVNGKTYMKALPLSYIDEKTGEGTYYITINSNNKLYKADSEITSWTFKVVIKPSDTVPIIISHENGSSTTDNITIALNTQNIYEQLGRVTLVVVRFNNNNQQYIYYQSEISSTSNGVLNTSIDDTGTYLIQIYSGRIENGSLSGNNLIFSYKVIRNEPFNAATIIIIVVSVIVAVAIIFLIIKLRKRISVK